MTKRKLNVYSSRITQPKSQPASQAMLHATGLTRADMDKAQVGIASVWYDGNSCNMHLNDLAALVRRAFKKPDSSGCVSIQSASPTASRWGRMA